MKQRHASAHVLLSLALAAAAEAQVRFTVVQRATESPVSGRLILGILPIDAEEEPNDLPLWGSPNPLLAVEVEGVAREGSVVIDERADSVFFTPPLPDGDYLAQARLIANRRSSSWRADPGNLYGEPVAFTVADGKAEVSLSLSELTGGWVWPGGTPVEEVVVRSRLLSEFHGRDVMLRAGVVKPEDWSADRRYAVVYEVPGFGGDHRGALNVAERGRGRLGREAFWVVLDPESPNGHTLFADSANNGPCGRALVEELIPAIEARFNLDPRPEARLLRGHSSGGWSVLWLAINYPETFGAAWSSAPDPVDFRAFQRTNIYADESMYARAGAGGVIEETPSMRAGQGGGSRVVMTVREENEGERILGPNQTSGQQWASWQAVFGPRDPAGHPAALYDERTGRIDPRIARAYRAYDIGHLVRTDPERYARGFFRTIRIVVGDEDNFYLNEAVELLREDLHALEPRFGPLEGDTHGIVIVPGTDHGSVIGSPQARAIREQMLAHLTRHGLARP